ncbi:hypothetical protein ACIBI4_33015 [Streptomyces sp. NPDC050418]|uniref:hypothetical protein n=1 Tax=Streptomyces sp. NPDC050418 TaxID=3365612 RepID=UPI0037A6123F
MAVRRQKVSTRSLVILVVCTVIAIVVISMVRDDKPLREGCRYVGKVVRCEEPSPTPTEDDHPYGDDDIYGDDPLGDDDPFG